MILPDQPHTSARILVVDDNPANVALLEAILDEAGFDHVEGLTDSREVVSRHLAQPYDLILLDIRMPYMDGHAVMRELSARLAPGQYLPVLVLTAQTDQETRSMALQNGARDFITKPFDAGDVLLRIRNLIEVRALYNERSTQAERLAALVDERTRALQEREQLLLHLASHDPVTGLPNRKALIDRLEFLLSQPHPNGLLLHLELNGHRRFEGLGGYELGENLLREVGRELALCSEARKGFLAHWNSSEFMLLLDGGDPAQERSLLEDLRARFRRPILLNGQPFVLTLRVGMVRLAEHGSQAHQLLRRAALALGSAGAGEPLNLAEFALVLETAMADRHRLDSELREAVNRDELLLYFQPKIQLATGQWVGAEALMRWAHPQHGLVPPGRFIPMAEENGMIAEFGLWAIDRALHQAHAWLAECGRPLSVAVNVSARQFELMRARGESLAARVEALLAHHKVDACLLELEITESAIMQDIDFALGELHRLRELGVALAIDDFGTGYSSLAYLRELPVTTLKIDRAFVHGIDDNQETLRLTRSVIDIARAFRLQIVAEGVEREVDARVLAGLGCDLVQGYFYGRPMPAADFLGAMATFSTPA